APRTRSLRCLPAAEPGDPLSVMDSSYLTSGRSALAGAPAAHVLARPAADVAGMVGAGVQGVQQLRSLAALRSLRLVRSYDLVAERAATFARNMTADLGIPVVPAESLAAAVREAGIILVATWAREPFILPGMLAPGTHVTTLGADEPGKAEVAAEVIRAALFVCDDRTLAVEMGALGGVGLGPEAVGAELGEVLSGVHPGRTSPQQLTVYGGVGLAFQDVVAAWAVYEAARRLGTGREIDFLAGAATREGLPDPLAAGGRHAHPARRDGVVAITGPGPWRRRARRPGSCRAGRSPSPCAGPSAPWTDPSSYATSRAGDTRCARARRSSRSAPPADRGRRGTDPKGRRACGRDGRRTASRGRSASRWRPRLRPRRCRAGASRAASCSGGRCRSSPGRSWAAWACSTARGSRGRRSP